ncbi:hypothetical protein [Ruegeria sp.]|uniref:hypothetical protein n=1 Tax=Ruegeria sp. TaxID=1879320 RepID=UPI003AFFAC10
MQAPLWWLGATDHGAPSPIFAEEIHDTAADLVAALAAIAVLTDLGGIAMRPEARAMLQEALDRHGPDLPEPVTLVPAPLAERGPRVAVRKVPRLLPRLLATGMVLGLAATVWLGLDPGRVTPPEPLRVTWQAPLPGALAASCGKGLQTIWPRRAGWQFEAMGCARPGALPDGLEAAETAPRDLVIWRRYSRERAANAVLAGAAAEALLAEWQGKGLQTDQGDVLLWYSTELATEIINPDGAAPLDTMARLLAGAWASTPDAVTRETRDRLRVDVGDLPAEVFTRLEALRGRMAHGPEILSLTWSQGRTTVLLRPRTGEII